MMLDHPSEFFLPGGANGVLLIHGLTGTPNEMRRVAKGLNQAGFTVYGVRLAGHCGTEQELLQTGWHDWFGSVERAAEKLRTRVDRLFVAGLSMGAIMALKYAMEHPDKVSGIGLYGPTFFYDGWAIPKIAKLSFLLPIFDRLHIGRKNAFMESYPYGIKNERLRKAISSKMLSGDAASAGLPGNPWPSLAEFYRLSREVQRRLREVKTPCIVLHAKEDDVASLRNAELVERRSGGPVTKVVLANSYHMITVDQEHHLVVAHSAEFFHRIAGTHTDTTTAPLADRAA